MTVQRDAVMVDRAYHRAFAVEWPSVACTASWLWKPLAIDGPKVVTTVFEPVPPSRLTASDSRRSIGSRNNAAAAAEGDGHVRVKNVRKVDALHRPSGRCRKVTASWTPTC